ncbi:MAG: MgtC/SapB family protein [Christensenellaceae bacterium]|nr:MgtC/SapB family protein [Christensenellaceae bacterium]
MLEIFDSLRSISMASVLLRLLLSALAGGLLGMERERKNRPAGFRTYMLVCVGAAMVMLTNQFVQQLYNLSDPVRMGAQVISGIGFLGAGTIVMTGKNKIKGITTAAGLWVSACCGLAIGVGFYELAVFGTVLVLLIISGMQRLDRRIRKHAKYIEVYLEYGSGHKFSEFIEAMRHMGIDVSDLQIVKNKMDTDLPTSVIMTISSSSAKVSHDEMIAHISAIPGVHYIEEI